ncbi:MAG: hypothetical protein ACJ8C4_15250 [Gemmataceae bacterium]
MSRDLYETQSHPQTDFSKALAEAHSALMDLRNVHSNDPESSHLAKEGEAVANDIVTHLERLEKLPRPQNATTVFGESLVHVCFGRLDQVYRLTTQEDEKIKAIAAALHQLVAICDKGNALNVLLPRVAAKYAAADVPNANRIRVTYEESWYGTEAHDWCCLHNSGAALDDALVVVELQGATERRTNVHFIPKWPQDGKRWACYEPGTAVLGELLGRTTVAQLEAVDVTILSPTFSTKVHYDYVGTVKDNSIAERCKKIALDCQYLTFQKGIFTDQQRGVKLTMRDYPWLGKCAVDISFVQGDEAKSFHWDVESWKEGETKILSTPPGGLANDPAIIRINLSFPATKYRPQWEVKLHI